MTDLEKLLEEKMKAYGDPVESFTRIAKFWSVLFGRDVTPLQVAQAMVLFKVARDMHTESLDNWEDISGYAWCGSHILKTTKGDGNDKA